MSSEQVAAEPGPQEPPRPAWVLPTVTGVAGFLVGVLTVGGIALGIGTASNLQHAAVTAKAQAQKKAAESKKQSMFKVALSECGLSEGPDSQLADGGYTLTVNGQGDDDFSGLAIDDEACLMRNLKAPSAVVSHVDQTSSMDGRQSESWGDVSMSWTYHPDRGLDAVFTLKK